MTNQSKLHGFVRHGFVQHGLAQNSLAQHGRTPPSARRQQGVALAVVLILLVVMTLLGLVAVRGTLMQEHMSASQYDRSLSFQAAEGALREAESVAQGRPNPASGCSNGICATPVSPFTPRWLNDATWAATSTEATTVLPQEGMTAKPRYLVEWMGKFDSPSCTTSGDVSETSCTEKENRYRITVRSQAAGRSDVTLQTNYAVP